MFSTTGPVLVVFPAGERWKFTAESHGTAERLGILDDLGPERYARKGGFGSDWLPFVIHRAVGAGVLVVFMPPEAD